MAITKEQQLEDVKAALGITGEYQDKTLLIYINEVKEYLKSAGVSDAKIESEKSVGVITRGVSDLWNYGSGGAKFSEYFIQRAIQLAMEEGC